MTTNGVPDEKNITTIIAEDLEVKGNIKFTSSLMIRGSVEGEIISEGLLIIGPTAKVKATITTKNFISHGEVTGNVTASEQVILKNTSTHNGDITTPNITIESGGVFNGSCIMKTTQPREMPVYQEKTNEEDAQTDKNGSSIFTKYSEIKKKL